MNRSAAFELFGEMRHSIPKEQKTCREMLKKYSTVIEGINIFEMDYKPYHLSYVTNWGFTYVPNWLRAAIEDGKVTCNHPEIIQDIWDLSYDYDGVPTLTVVETGKEFRMGGVPITFEDVYGE